MHEPRSFWSDAPVEPWRVVAERKIQELIERGALRNLPGEGQPLNLDENPFADPEMRVPFKILANAGVAPAWIELGQEVESARLRWQQFADQQRRRNARARERIHRMFGQVRDLAERRLAQTNAVAVAEYADGLRELNALVDRFNVCVPIFTLQRARVPIAAACRALARDLGLPEDAAPHE